MNNNLFLDYENHNDESYFNYLNSIELFKYKYEIFLCTSIVIVISIFTIIFNNINKKLIQEIDELKKIINENEDNLLNNNNIILEFNKILDIHKSNILINNQEINKLQENFNVHEDNLLSNNNNIIKFQDKIVDFEKKNNIMTNKLDEKMETYEDNLSIINKYIEYNTQNIILFGENINKGTNIFIHKNIEELNIKNLLIEDNIVIFLEQIKLLTHIREIKLSHLLRVNCNYKIILEFNDFVGNNISMNNKIIGIHKSHHNKKIDIDIIKKIEEYLIKHNIKLIIDIDELCIDISFLKNI